VFELLQPHFCVVLSCWRYLFGRMPLNSSASIVVPQETENEHHVWAFKWPAASCGVNSLLNMHHAFYNLPFSYTLSRLTWKLRSPKFRCEICFASYRREFILLASLVLYSPEPKKTLWYHVVLCIQIIIVLKREKFCSNISPGFVVLLCTGRHTVSFIAVLYQSWYIYSDTLANEDNSFWNHIC